MKRLVAVYRDGGHPSISLHQLNHDGAQVVDSFSPHGFVFITEDDKLPGGFSVASYPVLRDEHFRELEGKVLTVADATFTDPKQAEAVKSLFKNEMRRWFNDRVDELYETAYGSTKSKNSEGNLTEPVIKLNK